MSRNDHAPLRHGDVVAALAWATTVTAPYAAEPSGSATPSGAVPETSGPTSAPALNPPTWSGRKTAIAAALAVGSSAVGAAGAAADVPTGAAQPGPGCEDPSDPNAAPT
jgi:hypothetical protein